MNEDRTPESVEFARLEDRMKSLRPAEVPDFVQARLQFELGRMQGRQEARRLMLAYASAACLAVWAGTTWLERSKSAVSNGTIVMNVPIGAESRSKSPGEPKSTNRWTVDEIRSLARYEAAIRGDARLGNPLERSNEPQNAIDRQEPLNPAGPWNRQRWMQELLGDPSTASG